MTKTTTILWAVVGVLFVALAGLAAYKALPILHPQVGGTANLNPECDLRAGPCRSDLPGGGQVSFAIKTPGIPLVKPLDLEVRVQGVEATQVEVDFVGLEMNMGFNRPKLQAQGAGLFTGAGMLPVCVRVAMEWEARVLVTTPRGLLAAPFRFITAKEGAVLPGGRR
ncbi:hypothetical protein [Sedimenticola sp.]|uniref:hypothetical protein n=1 Tax=Sedimenticola sp. TaxID=1940285 RepID=UPI003D1429DF